MTEWVVALSAGFAVALAGWFAGREIFASPVLQRENYRGHRLPTAGGLLVVLALISIEAVRALAGALGEGRDAGLSTERAIVLFAVLGFGLLGLVDDLLGAGDSRGFRGHVAAALRGRITTGFVKLAGGGMLAVVLVATPGFASGRRIAIDAVLVALCANLANLFDRAPGRTIKAGLLAYLPLLIVLGTDPVGVAIAPVIGAVLALFASDLRERVMLGDTGANILGAVLGLGVALGVDSDAARLCVLAGVALLNIASEFVSFSRVIEGVAPLRAVDRLGRSSPRAAVPPGSA